MRRVSGGEPGRRQRAEPPGQVERGAAAIDPGLTEGKKTEPVYLAHWHRLDRKSVV